MRRWGGLAKPGIPERAPPQTRRQEINRTNRGVGRGLVALAFTRVIGVVTIRLDSLVDQRRDPVAGFNRRVAVEMQLGQRVDADAAAELRRRKLLARRRPRRISSRPSWPVIEVKKTFAWA